MSIFNQVQMTGVPSNSFDLSHDVKLSMNMGDLVPVQIMECIPGDQVKLSSTVMARLAPMVSPVMHKIDIDVQHFFVPNRLLWQGWEKFITTGTPDVSTPAAPYFQGSYTHNIGGLADYLGLPTGVAMTQPINALPFAAYQKIYQDYYRDQNLISEFEPILNDGLNSYSDNWFGLRKRAWNHDYFTSALPFAQKGDEVTIDLGTSAPVVLSADGLSGVDTGVWRTQAAVTAANATVTTVGGGTTSSLARINDGGTYINATYDPNGSLEADLSAASSITINQLRWAVKLQEFLERNARGGTRYIEHILAHFGVHSSDKRLQRAEFLGGSRQHMVISEVLQNAPSNADTDTPQGNMAGHGISVGSGNDFKYFVEEHGFIISICSIRPKTAYYQGLHRLWTRFDPLQYAFPSFANLGEQEIYNKELYYSEADSLNDDVFGYIPRYSEYKYQDSRVAGDFREQLEFWHMARKFATRPQLNQTFIECNPTTRIFAVEDGVHHIYAQFLNDLTVRRRLPKYGIPTL